MPLESTNYRSTRDPSSGALHSTDLTIYLKNPVKSAYSLSAEGDNCRFARTSLCQTEIAERWFYAPKLCPGVGP